MGKQKKKNLKRMGIIGGAALVGTVVADVIAVAAAPVTGGLSLGVVAMTKTTQAALLAGAGGAIVGGGTAAVVTKIADSKREKNAYNKGVQDGAEPLQKKYDELAKSFLAKENAWIQANAKQQRTNQEKENVINECLSYIEQLEAEQDELKKQNKQLSKEKQELLSQLRAMESRYREGC